MNRETKYEFERLVKNRLRGIRPGQELCLLCHPDDEERIADIAKAMEPMLGTGETVGVVTDKDCPRSKMYVVNRDYYDQFHEQPWKVMH